VPWRRKGHRPRRRSEMPTRGRRNPRRLQRRLENGCRRRRKPTPVRRRINRYGGGGTRTGLEEGQTPVPGEEEPGTGEEEVCGARRSGGQWLERPAWEEEEAHAGSEEVHSRAGRSSLRSMPRLSVFGQLPPVCCQTWSVPRPTPVASCAGPTPLPPFLSPVPNLPTLSRLAPQSPQLVLRQIGGRCWVSSGRTPCLAWRRRCR
jgi:hypothetical protein